MFVDFKHMKIYYGGTRDDYSDAKGVLSADLTQEDKDDLFSNDNELVYLRGTDQDSLGFPGFDDYWKGIYKKYFGKEYSFPY